MPCATVLKAEFIGALRRRPGRRMVRGRRKGGWPGLASV